MREITPHGFEHDVRSRLHNVHDFDSKQLDKLRGAYDHALVEMKQHSLDKDHFDAAWEHMESHPALKDLSPKKLDAAKSVFREHLGIQDDATPQ